MLSYNTTVCLEGIRDAEATDDNEPDPTNYKHGHWDAV